MCMYIVLLLNAIEARSPVCKPIVKKVLLHAISFLTICGQIHEGGLVVLLYILCILKTTIV